ncbi:MAG TPA: tetratricopeptide repeat protein [Pseudonocardiaceae bacterium]|jgi:tetratricopeptide (TPR) repeat protein|nr:tetratricopeptide repeat protein [Pseudonocardiaceae bacterium]
MSGQADQRAVHRTILVVDVEGFGDQRRNNPNQLAVRSGMYQSLELAFGAAEIPWRGCRVEDRGDGIFVLAPPDVPKSAFVESLPSALSEALRRHNLGHPSEEQIRLRMVLHAGEVNYDAHGVAAASVNHAFRLLEAPQLKVALAESSGVLALIVSAWFYEEVVRQSPVVDLASYRQIDFSVKETNGQAWINLPDHKQPRSATPPDAVFDRSGHQPANRLAPRDLPALQRTFVGRINELAALTEALDAAVENDSIAISVIAGMGGLGKTWLAVEWAHKNTARFPDGQIYVNLRGFDPSSDPVAPAVVIRRFLDALQLPAGSIPLDADAQAALYRNQVAGRRMLIILDNASNSEQVIPLLPATPTCMVLVTSREQLHGLITRHEARPVPLGTLGDLDAEELLAKRLGRERVAAEQDAVSELVRHCAGLPLALAIIAAHAATHPDFPLSALASELSETSGPLDALSGGELTANLRAVLSRSFDALTAEAAEVLRLLASVPGPDIAVPAASVLIGRPGNDVAALLNQLENAHLILRYSPKRYRMHDLIRLYATERVDADGQQRCTDALRRLISYYVYATYAGERLLYPHRKNVEIGEPPADYPIPIFDDDTSILQWFDAERFCLLTAQEAAVKRGWHRFVWQLAWTLHGYLWRRGHLLEQLHTWQLGLAASQELRDPLAEGVASRLLGQACARAGMNETASEHLHRALKLARQTGDTHGEARAHYDLTWVWRKSDDEQALGHAIKALRLFRTLDAPVWEAEALSMMGWHQAQLGRYDVARESCEQAFSLFHQEGNRQGQAVTLDYLGYIAYYCGEYGQALNYLRESLDVCRDLGATYYQADTLDHLGLTLAASGHADEARLVWRQALSLNRVQDRTADVQRIEQQLAVLEDTA